MEMKMRDRTPKLSVIIPVYNEENYIGECLESVLNQSFRDIEVICVDDGSTDSTVSILEEICSNDPRVTVIHQKNEYAGAARNRGLLRARGEYVHFMDGDDWLEKDAYEEWYSIAKDQDADVCIGFHRNHDMLTGKIENRGSSPSKNYICVTNIIDNARSLFNSAVVPWNKIYRRDFLMENDLKFEQIQCANDRSFYFKVISRAKSIAIIRRYFVNYRMNIPGALTGEGRLQHFDCHFKSFETIWEWFKDDEKEIRVMALDVCINDMFAFYNKATGTKYEKSVRSQFRTYLKNLDLSEFSEEIKTCRWYMHYLLLITTEDDDEAAYCELLRELNHKEEQLAEKHRQLKRLKEKEQEAQKYRKQLSDMQHSVSYRAGRIATFPLRKVRGCIRNYKKYGVKYTARYAKWYVKDKASKFFHKQSVSKPLPWGLTKEKREEKIIVSLTSYPGRIHLVHKTIETLLQQTVKPDMVILWLAESQFPNKNHDLPKELLRLKKSGLTIDWCEDIRSYKKLIPTLRKYPDDVIVTADDDAYYDKRWLERLYASYLCETKKFIHCHRITRMYLINDEWKTVTAGKMIYPQPTFLHKLVGLGGVLYPPHTLHEDVLDENKFLKLAPTNDDIWFWLMATLKGTRIISIPGAMPAPKLVEGTQENGALSKVNDQGEKLFRRDFSEVINAYPTLKDTLKKEYAKMHQLELLYRIKDKNEAYFMNLEPALRPYELMIWFRKRKGFFLDLENPQTYNEKIQWMKIYENTPEKAELADKYAVREYVKKEIGGKYLVPLLGVWDRAEDIDFDLLPERFVLKANHGCGYNIIVKDKSTLDIDVTKKKLNTWLDSIFGCTGGMELQYMSIPPKIIAEEYLENKDGDLYDYKVWCFHGKAKYIQFIAERKDGLKMVFYDLNWNKMPFVYSYPQYEKDVKKPESLNELIMVAEKLAAPFKHVRVDFYVLNNGEIKFGEMTFSSASGCCKWEPAEYDKVLGEMLLLAEVE